MQDSCGTLEEAWHLLQQCGSTIHEDVKVYHPVSPALVAIWSSGVQLRRNPPDNKRLDSIIHLA